MRDLDEKVTFYSPTQVSDGYGGTVAGWTEEFTTRAHFRYLRGGESVQAARLRGRQPVVATVRLSGDTDAVRPDWRMDDARRAVAFNIRAIVPTSDRLFLEITAESGVEV